MSLDETQLDPTNKTEEVKALIIKKIDGGFVPNDKNTVNELRKQVIDELKLSPNWRTKVKSTIAEVLTEKNISLADKGFNTNKLGALRVELVKSDSPEPSMDPQPTKQPELPSPTQTPQSPHGTLPKGFGTEPTQRQLTQTEQQEQNQTLTPKAPITPEQKAQQEKLIVKSFGFLEEVYVALGIVKGNEEEQKAIAEPKPLEKFHGDVKDFAHELNEYMIENDVRLPQYLNVLAIAVSGFMIFGMPLVKFFVFSKKDKPDYDNRFDDIEVKA